MHTVAAVLQSQRNLTLGSYDIDAYGLQGMHSYFTTSNARKAVAPIMLMA